MHIICDDNIPLTEFHQVIVTCCVIMVKTQNLVGRNQYSNMYHPEKILRDQKYREFYSTSIIKENYNPETRVEVE